MHLYLAALVPPAALGVLATEPTNDLLGYLQSGGVIGMFVVLTWSLVTRRVVMGWTYDAMVQERDYYREIAHKGIELADRQVTVAEALAERAGILDNRAALISQREAGRIDNG